MIVKFQKTRALLSKEHKKSLMVLLIIIFFGMLFEVIGLGSLLPLIKILLDPESIKLINDNFSFLDLQTLNYSELLIYCFITIGLIFLFKAFILIYVTYKQNLLIESITATLSNKLYKKYLLQDYKLHLFRDLSQLIKNLQIEITNFTIFLRSFLFLLVEVSFSSAILITIFIIEPLGAISVGLFFIIFSILYYQITKKKIKKWGNERENIDKSISKILLESLSGIKEVKLFSSENFFYNLYQKSIYLKSRVSTKHQTFSQIPRFYLELLTVFGLIIFIQIMFLKGSSTSQILSTLGVFVAATFRMIPSINRTLSSLQNLKYYEPSIDVIYNEFSSNENSLEFKNDNSVSFSKRITVKEMSFSYKNEEVLSKINLNIKRGETIGIIGESGSGKSTLVDVLVGLLNPTNGDVLVDDFNIHKSPNNWKNLIGYVGQDLFLLDDTIASNIAFGIEEKNINYKTVEDVIKATKLDMFIKKLENGYNTKVGERGIQLSGGQKQRIGIARALYHNPEVLIFDEATASLDSETEKKIMKEIYGLKNSKTIVLIAHRISTLSECDRLYKVENSKLVMCNKKLILNSKL